MSKTPFGYSENMPESIRDLFGELCNELLATQSKWDFFVRLYGTDANTALFSELGLGAFNVIYDALRNDTIVGISRLTDSSRSMGHENLTLSMLAERCTDLPDHLDLAKRCSQLHARCQPIKDARNKRVAHRDYQNAIMPVEFPLPGIPKSLIDKVLNDAAGLLNTVYKHYHDNSQFLDFHGGTEALADGLIFWLNVAKASDETSRGDIMQSRH